MKQIVQTVAGLSCGETSSTGTGVKICVAALSSFLLNASSGFGWGADGHQAIAAAAFQRLHAPSKAAILKIMSQSSVPELQDVATAATWPDDIRISENPAHSGRLVDA